MTETKPLIENLAKKVVIKTIETRDGHVCKNHEALTLQYKYLKEKKSQYKMILFIFLLCLIAGD